MDAARMPATESRLERLGEAVALALLPAVVGAVPGGWRVAAAGGSAIDGWLVSAAIVLLMLLPLALLRGRAARGWRGLVGAAPPKDLGVGLAMWVGLSVAFLMVLGGLLEARTHHSGLAGATFGLLGLGAAMGAAVIAHRLLTLGSWLRARGWPPWILASAAGVVAVGPTFGAATPWLLSRTTLEPSSRAAVAVVVDLLVVTSMASALFVRGLPAFVRPIAVKAAVPLGAFLLVVGGVRTELGAGVTQSVRAGGGLAAVVLWVLERWSDRDADGFSAHFGGNDCDEGDPTRHPGAPELPADGIDSNCDGHDEPGGGAAAMAAQAGSASAGADAGAAALAEAGQETSASAAAAPSASSATAEAKPLADAGAPKQPDIILVTLDTVGAGHCSTYGYARETTPALTSLSGGGIRFAHAFAPGSSTQAALTPLVTCRAYGDSRRSADEWPTLLDENDTLAERLGRAGYATAAVVSFTWLRQDRGFHQGFDTFDESPFRADHPERGTTGVAATSAFRTAYESLVAKEAPIFLWVHLFDAHAKYVEHEGIDFGKSDADRYDGEIAFTDRQLAAIVAQVSTSPRAARTLWLVHGSHGEAFGEHESQGHGTDLWNEMLQVPFVVAAPWIAPRTYDTGAVSTLDIAPTLLALAGASLDAAAGVSLLPLLRGEATIERPPIVAYAPRRVAVIDWPIKLLVRRRTAAADRLLLFDLGSDPTERTDVSGDRKADLLRMTELWNKLE